MILIVFKGWGLYALTPTKTEALGAPGGPGPLGPARRAPRWAPRRLSTPASATRKRPVGYRDLPTVQDVFIHKTAKCRKVGRSLSLKLPLQLKVFWGGWQGGSNRRIWDRSMLAPFVNGKTPSESVCLVSQCAKSSRRRRRDLEPAMEPAENVSHLEPLHVWLGNRRASGSC